MYAFDHVSIDVLLAFAVVVVHRVSVATMVKEKMMTTLAVMPTIAMVTMRVIMMMIT